MFGAVDLVFTRYDGIEVNYRITLKDINDMNENFTIIKVSLINTPAEIRLFYHFDKRDWTLNEFIFFAENNGMCISIYDVNNNLIKQYGECLTGINGRIFGLCFNSKFN